jgi:hypothetical protein
MGLILNQMEAVHKLSFYYFNIRFNIILPAIARLQIVFFPWGFPTKTLHDGVLSFVLGPSVFPSPLLSNTLNLG